MAVTGPFDKQLNYIGLSSDTKPTEGINPGSLFVEEDTKETYIYSGSAWTKDKEEVKWQSKGLMR
jgi:hypothetical protein